MFVALVGIQERVDHLPSPDRAERNQRRKLAFIPMWPVVASVVLLVGLFLWLR
jgi:type VI protein secretion system component VasF